MFSWKVAQSIDTWDKLLWRLWNVFFWLEQDDWKMLHFRCTGLSADWRFLRNKHELACLHKVIYYRSTKDMDDECYKKVALTFSRPNHKTKYL